ncbi:MAG TPA: AraD1 family protein [Blastocatellia bacterium]|nr:AraD1 family protein [Blastocatellia bacterium]
MRLIQLTNSRGERRVCSVEENRLRVVGQHESVYALAQAALATGSTLAARVSEHLLPDELDYQQIYEGRSEWRILPPIDHPDEAARCTVSGTGLTHRGSADNRQAMHAADAAPTDSMRMFQWGIDGGRPAPGQVGVSPEWFYKGPGTILRAHGEPLEVPDYAEDGGEEGELAGVYLIDAAGAPRRLGMTVGNEFSDHRFEKKNYLYLAASKLRTCSIGPELVVDPDYSSVPGEVAIERDGVAIWTKSILTGDAAMSHSLENMEHHHFKHEAHRRPGDLHIHFFGAAALSFGDGIELIEGDIMQVSFAGFGRPLRNPVRISRSQETLVGVHPL